MPLKIAMYIPLLETLFSTDETTEITHKISERIAIYLGGTTQQKIENYKLIQSAYSIRSNLLHSSKLSTDSKPERNHSLLQTQQEIYKELDTCVCTILVKIIQKDSKLFDGKTDLNIYFSGLLSHEVRAF